MSLFPTEMESERLHLDDADPFELYEHARPGAPDVDEITGVITRPNWPDSRVFIPTGTAG